MMAISRSKSLQQATRSSAGKVVSIVLRYALLIILAILFLIPFYLIVRNGLATDQEITSPNWTLFPNALHFENIQELLADLFRQFFLSFPRELEGAGRVDGLGYWGIFWRIVAPNAWGIISALSAITFIASWNDFLWPLVVGQDESAWTVQVVLSGFLNAQVLNLHELFIGAAVATLPLVIIFLMQRYIIEGYKQSGLKSCSP